MLTSPNDERLTTVTGFSVRVRQSAANVLGDSTIGREIASLCDRHEAARKLLLEDRGNGLPVITVAGPTAQGKSTLAKWLAFGSEAAGEREQNTECDDGSKGVPLTWYGPNPPAFLDPMNENYRHCSTVEMESIGLPYLLLDSTSFNDTRASHRELSHRALGLSSVVVLVVRADQIRSEVVTYLTQLSEGTLVVPVINAIRETDEPLLGDVQSLVTRLREIAPSSTVTDAVLVEDFEIGGRTEDTVGTRAAADVASQIRQTLGGKWEDERRRAARLNTLDLRFRRSLHQILCDQLPGLTSAVGRLREESRRVPMEIAESLVGQGGPLQAAIRSRLRLTLLTDTAAFWFPYRSIVAVMNWTHGAWDRILISLSGSLPSLIGAMWTSAKDRKLDQNAVEEVRRGIERRGELAVVERLEPLAGQFRRELFELRSEDHSRGEASRYSEGETVAKLSGLGALQEESQRIFEEAIQQGSPSRWRGSVLGLVGTAIFWGLMAAPIIAIYSEYVGASLNVFRGLSVPQWGAVESKLDQFPSPNATMLMTSVLLSLLPTAVYAMFVLSSIQSYRRVKQVEESIRSRHHEAIESLQRSGVLRLRWDDPLLSDAEFLLTIGSVSNETQQSASALGVSIQET